MKFVQNGAFKPKLEVINKKQMWDIHQAALDILKTTGFDMQHRQVRKMLLDAGCSISRKGRICMPAGLVENAWIRRPKRFCCMTNKVIQDWMSAVRTAFTAPVPTPYSP